MPVSDKEYRAEVLLRQQLEREANQRAVDLLATTNASRISNRILVSSVLVAIAAVIVAVLAILYK